MEEKLEWHARRILTEIADREIRMQILTTFWRRAEQTARVQATLLLARALRFRDETIRKAPVEKKAEWLATRLGSPDFHDTFDLALMLYLTHEQSEMLSAFLDAWGIPHVGGAIEADDYAVPAREAVERAVADLSPRFDRKAIALYLASAGLLMGGAWRDATWPAVNAIVGER